LIDKCRDACSLRFDLTAQEDVIVVEARTLVKVLILVESPTFVEALILIEVLINSCSVGSLTLLGDFVHIEAFKPHHVVMDSPRRHSENYQKVPM
jgi:hypothetical protein